MIAGDKKDIAFVISNSEEERMHKLSFYIDEVDILAGWINGRYSEYEWYIDGIMEWLESHINIILVEDPYPLSVNGETAAELHKNSYSLEDNDDETDDQIYEKYSKLQGWDFNHNWARESRGSYVAGIFFRRVGKYIEISWDNEPVFVEDGGKHKEIVYASPKGKKYVEPMKFKEIVESICASYFGKK